MLTCRGIASQQTPNMAHFLGVRKYTGPGWNGSDGYNAPESTGLYYNDVILDVGLLAVPCQNCSA